MSVVKKILSKVLPKQAKDFVFYLKRTPRRVSVYLKRLAGRVATKELIVKGLKEMGIKEGETIFVHTSLSSFGFVEGGPMAVIGALLETVGPKGNVCLPAFGPLSDGKTFDVKKTPSAQGKISEIFWRLPNAKRSLRSSHCIACIGKDAEFITKDHHLDETPFGKNSPYEKMLSLNGKVIALGSPLRRSLTCNYIIEDRLGDKFPVKVYNEKPTSFFLIDENGKKYDVLHKTHDISIDYRRVDHNPGLSEGFEQHLVDKKCLKRGQIGEARVLVYCIKCLIDCLGEMVKGGKTIYAPERKEGEQIN